MTSMPTALHPFSTRLRFPPLLVGAIAVGTFDLLFACTWWKIAANVPPTRIFHSIASGWYGEAAFEGGTRTAIVGVLSHYFIAACMVAAYALVASRLPMLIRRPLRWGTAYGLFLYAAMNFVVVPLSAADPQPLRLTAWTMASVLVHASIGIACAYFARAALRRQ